MENPIQKWITEDSSLYNLIVEIQETEKSPEEQAKIAFSRLCKLYDISEMPIVLENDPPIENEVLSRSLFEEHALLKFLAPENEDPRGIVLSAAHHILNNHQVSYYEIARKEFGDNIPAECKIGIAGENYESKVIFLDNEKDKDWLDLGCVTIATVDKKNI